MGHHVDVVRKRCRFDEGCDRWPSFAEASSSTPLYCRAHKADGHVDVRHKRCEAPGCVRQPIYGSVEEMTPRWCLDHKLASHVDVKHRRRKNAAALDQAPQAEATVLSSGGVPVLAPSVVAPQEKKKPTRRKAVRLPPATVNLP
ncbi:hypothetical protein T484DRAFT_1773166 [Baffinella frigidus]|nr:hypothetical protein T484DRAFT_1773166 [Cryptophyta sp. CCMP2293]